MIADRIIEVIAIVFAFRGIDLFFCQFNTNGPNILCEHINLCSLLDDFENAHADKITKHVVGSKGRKTPTMPNASDVIPRQK